MSPLRFARRLSVALGLATAAGLLSYDLLVAVPVTSAAAVPHTTELAIGPATSSLDGIHKIQHVVIVMQENHSFDNYFGTYPGADGIPMKAGVPVVCLTDPQTKACIKPFLDSSVSSFDPPHHAADAVLDVNGGRMDGFLAAAARNSALPCAILRQCSAKDVKSAAGYHDAGQVPVYWGYANQYVLQDHLFAPAASFTLPSHLALLSGWVATCPTADPMACESNVVSPEVPHASKALPYAWTDITYLLHKNNVSWAFYTGSSNGDCSPAAQCSGGARSAFDQYVSPLSGFQTVSDNGQLENIKPTARFFEAAKSGTLPAVSWVTPDPKFSEHPPESITDGQAYVASLVNAVMNGPDWNSTAIFITWDEWGGFYDHVQPPMVEGAQLGMRVPGLVISPYAKQGYIDHQTLTFQSYLKFIEDDFLGGQRLDPKTDGRPDSRPAVLDNSPAVGTLIDDFDFSQTPRLPIPVQVSPST